MAERREAMKKKMIERQIVEIRTAVTNLEDALNGALFHDFSYATVSVTVCKMAINNLKDFEKRYLLGQIGEG